MDRQTDRQTLMMTSRVHVNVHNKWTGIELTHNSMYSLLSDRGIQVNKDKDREIF